MRFVSIRLTVMLLMILASMSFAVTKYVHVNPSAASGGDGTMWSKAYNNLQTAFDANVNPTDSVVFLLAEGVYKPTMSNRNDFFYHFGSAAVTIRGGHCQNNNAQRKDYCQTIISADVLDNDLQNVPLTESERSIRISYGGDLYDNKFYLFSFNGTQLGLINVRFEWITFKGVTGRIGNLESRNFHFQNCRFVRNYTNSTHGIVDQYPMRPVTYDGCIFTDNTSKNGVLVASDDRWNQPISVSNSLFKGNRAFIKGGGQSMLEVFFK